MDINDLSKLIQSIPKLARHFRGIYKSNDLSSAFEYIDRSGVNALVIFHESDKTPRHYLGIYADFKLEILYFIDAHAHPPAYYSLDVFRFLELFQMKMNSLPFGVQPVKDSNTSSMFTLYYLLMASQDVSLTDASKLFSSRDRSRNVLQLKKWFKKHFRDHDIYLRLKN